jgi:catechol 2,3-dioxygenase-like lactoylglutathione lyase family enzyme
MMFRTSSPRRPLTTSIALVLLGACGGDPGEDPVPPQPNDLPELHHVGLNSVDPSGAIDWYLAVWPSATRAEMDGKPAVESEMYLVFNEVADPPAGAFEPSLGRPAEQSAFWHIGAFLNTTDTDVQLADIGVAHLPLYTGVGEETVWRSGLTPYTGIVTAETLDAAEPSAARPGGFSYVLAPDGVLFELTGGAQTTPSMSHVHFFHEAPLCAANWYVENLGMTLPPMRNEDGSTTARPLHEPCDADRGAPGWPSLESAGTIRAPRATVVHGTGSMSWYPRQCVDGRCGQARPLVPSRGQALDHVAFLVDDVAAWHSWLTTRGVVVIEDPHPFDGGRAIMIEGPDRLAIELVEAAPAAP